MRGLRTLLVSVALCCLPILVQADMLRRVASCTGRLSAQMEHEWITDTARATQTRAARNAMADVLEAMVTPPTARASFAARVDAKHAHHQILQRSRSGWASSEKRRAARIAEHYIRQCRSLLTISADTASRAVLEIPGSSLRPAARVSTALPQHELPKTAPTAPSK